MREEYQKEYYRRRREYKRRRISCVWVQVVCVPRDEIARIENPVGTRIMLNKKKSPYLWKYGYLKFRDKNGLQYKLYEDEIILMCEKSFSWKT